MASMMEWFAIPSSISSSSSILPVSWETCVLVKKQQLEPCMEQLTGSRLRKVYNRAVSCHPVCLTSEHVMRNAGLDELQAGIKIGRRNINNLRYVDDTALLAESEAELQSLLMRVKERVKEPA